MSDIKEMNHRRTSEDDLILSLGFFKLSNSLVDASHLPVGVEDEPMLQGDLMAVLFRASVSILSLCTSDEGIRNPRPGQPSDPPMPPPPSPASPLLA